MNNNVVDAEKDLPSKIYDCFTYNKELEEISIRFCNLTEPVLIKMFEGLISNRKLKKADIS